MDLSNNIKQIKELPDFHLWDLAAMVNYSDFFEDHKIEITVADKEYELQDFYCKNPDCDCTNTMFSVQQYGEVVGEIWYNYEKEELLHTSDYGHLLDELKTSNKQIITKFHEVLKHRHIIIKNAFEILKLKAERDRLKQKESSLKNQINLLKKHVGKIGRNEPCPCGSGKKYKKCCI